MCESRRDRKNQRGVISIYIMLMAGLFLIMGVMGLTLQDAETLDSETMTNEVQARYLAQSALSEGRFYTAEDSDWEGTSPEQEVVIDGKSYGTYEYSVVKSGGNVYDLTGTGYVPNKADDNVTTQSFSVRYYNPAPLVLFSDGFEANNLSQWTVYTDNAAHIVFTTSNAVPKSGTYHARAYKTAASNNGTTNVAHITSPVLDLSAYDTVILRFTYRMKNGQGPNFRVLQNSTGNVADWVEIYNDTSSATEDAYAVPSVQLSISPRTSTMQFRFEAQIGNKNEEWRIDAIEISTPFVLYDAALDT